MRKRRFVTPQVDRVPLSEGDWIEVKHALTVGERRQAQLGAVRGVRRNEETGEITYDVDGPELAKGMVEAYLTDWSFRDDDDKPVTVTPAAIEALDPEAFAEIVAAIEAHIERVEQEKKATRGSSGPAPTSASVT